MTTESYLLEIFTDLRGRLNAGTSSWGVACNLKFWVALPRFVHCVWLGVGVDVGRGGWFVVVVLDGLVGGGWSRWEWQSGLWG